MKRRIFTVGTTFFLAAATGHVMQNGDVLSAKLRGAMGASSSTAATPAAASTMAAKPVATEAAAATESAAATETQVPAEAEGATKVASGLPEFPAESAKTLTSGVLLAARMDAVGDNYRVPETDANKQYSVFGIPCGASELSLGLAGGGVLAAKLSAPCHPSERVIFSHAGLSFALMTDAAGLAKVDIPAMMRDSTVEVAFVDGEALVAERVVPELDALRRFAISGGSDLHLNVVETGATPGETSVAVLGDPEVELPIFAEIYTAGDGARDIEISAEASVTEANCGRAIKANVVSMQAGRVSLNETLSQAMPECDAIGDMVVAVLPGWSGAVSLASAAE